MTITALARNFNGEPNMVTMVTTSSSAAITTAGFWDLPATVADVELLQNGPFQWYPTDFVAGYTSDGFSFYTFDSATSAFVQATAGGAGVLLPVTPNYIPIFAETNGTISMSDGTIRTNFSIIADPGIGFIAQSPTPLNGSIGLFAQDAGGNFNLFINNETMTQSTAMVVPNVVNSHGKFMVAAGETPFVDKHLPIATGTLGVMIDSGAQLLTGNTGVFEGGSTNNAFAIAGMTSSSVGVCVIKQSTNPVSIVKAIASAGFVTVTFSADPGAGTILNYVYTTNPLA